MSKKQSLAVAVGERIATRLDANYTTTHLAADLCLSPRQVRKWQSDEGLNRLDRIQATAQALTRAGRPTTLADLLGLVAIGTGTAERIVARLKSALARPGRVCVSLSRSDAEALLAAIGGSE